MKYYSLNRILEHNAKFNVIFGERSNGKTYSVLKLAVENFIKTGKQLAIVRRFEEDYKGKRGATVFDGLVENNEISKLSKGKWNSVYYYSGRWYLCRYEDDARITCETPLAYGFAISSMEHDKSSSYPNITTILFDEFITRTFYLNDEFVLFMNTLSTIIRHRNDVTIFMLGNTVNQYCPYFQEMGLTNAKKMKEGDLDVYTYGTSGLIVAVERTLSGAKRGGKKSDVYFAFNNPKLRMITGGEWEIDVYPHAPCKILPKDIVYTFYIEFDGEVLQANIVVNESMIFCFVHRKTTGLKYKENDLIFSTGYSPLPTRLRNILKPTTKLGIRIKDLIDRDLVFYQDNTVGEVFANYLKFCIKN